MSIFQASGYVPCSAVQTYTSPSLPPPYSQVHRQLAPTSRYFIGPKLDQHIDAVVQNSMAVAHVSRDKYREVILRLCSEVGVAESCDQM